VTAPTQNKWDVLQLGSFTIPPVPGVGFVRVKCTSSVQIDKGKQSVKGKNKGTTTMQGSPAFPVHVRYTFLFEHYDQHVAPLLKALDPSSNRSPMKAYHPDLDPRRVGVVVVEEIGPVEPPEGGQGLCSIDIKLIEWNPPPPKGTGKGKGSGELEGAELAKFFAMQGTGQAVTPGAVAAAKAFGNSAGQVGQNFGNSGAFTLFKNVNNPFSGAGGGSAP
jgi:hypothetical protein